MPQLPLPRGQSANLGAGTVLGNLQIIGVGANYTIAIGGGAAAAHTVVPGGVDTYPVNGQAVTVVSTDPAGGPVNLQLSW